MDLLIVGLALLWLFVALGGWLGYQLFQQNGRILLRLEALEKQLAPARSAPSARPSLPLGSPAPEFELPDLAGRRRSLAEFRGRRVLLIFFNPRCGFCARMAPELAALPVDGKKDRPVPLVVSTGDVEENRRLVEEHGIRGPVLIQEPGTHGMGGEVASRYQTGGTPTGYLIDAQGKIASEIAVGAQALLALADPAAAREEPSPAESGGARVHRGNRSLAESRINRSGLPAGTPAPDFTLPRLGGGELSLAEFRGRKVLLVFSAPTCGPCDQLAPELEQRVRRTPEVQVLMVSKGEVEANRAKAEQHRLTFPIVLQQQWEISRLYGMFMTPIAYLIDEEGIIAAEAAVGLPAILELLSAAATRAGTNGKPRRRPCGKVAGECRCGSKTTSKPSFAMSWARRAEEHSPTRPEVRAPDGLRQR